MSTQRILWIDYAKAFSICAVVIYHTQMPYPTKGIFYALCLPFFFFCSGLFANNNTDLSVKTFLNNIFKRRICPYIIWSTISIIIGSVEYYFFNHSCINLWTLLYGYIYGTSQSIIYNKALWFLPCLCLIECIFYFTTKISRSTIIKVLFILLLWSIGLVNVLINSTILPLGIGASLIVLPIYALGTYTFKHIKHLQQLSNIWLFVISLFAFCFIILIYFINPDVKISDNHFGHIELFYLNCICCITIWICLGTLMARFFQNTWFSDLIGQHTLFILGSHLLIFKIIKLAALFIFRIPLSLFENNYLMSL